MSFKYYNANAKGRHTNDCVVRAISLAEDKTWNETYKELSELAQSQGILLDDSFDCRNRIMWCAWTVKKD